MFKFFKSKEKEIFTIRAEDLQVGDQFLYSTYVEVKAIALTPTDAIVDVEELPREGSTEGMLLTLVLRKELFINVRR